MRGGRARWKVENETFNTLKNQGYHFEHNSGHGKKHLSVVFAPLMMLAFLVDQVQQLGCALFQAVLDKKRSRKRLWEQWSRDGRLTTPKPELLLPYQAGPRKGRKARLVPRRTKRSILPVGVWNILCYSFPHADRPLPRSGETLGTTYGKT